MRRHEEEDTRVYSPLLCFLTFCFCFAFCFFLFLPVIPVTSITTSTTENNQLTGSLPTELGKLTNLKHLLLKSNELSGKFPSELNRLSHLQVMIVDKNDFVGSAEPICSLPKVEAATTAARRYFVSDCKSEVVCPCCALCCADADKMCNTGDWNGNLQWNHNEREDRVSFTYDMGSHTVTFP